MISFSQAQENLKALFASWLAEQTLQTERMNLQQALGRYLASAVFASLDLPRDNVSAMDGYALSPLKPDAVSVGEEYTLLGESRAGEPYAGSALKAGECVRIFTGAVVPSVLASHRVLHGREAITSSGYRHLQDAYFEHDNIRNMLTVLERSHG